MNGGDTVQVQAGAAAAAIEEEEEEEESKDSRDGQRGSEDRAAPTVCLPAACLPTEADAAAPPLLTKTWSPTATGAAAV